MSKDVFIIYNYIEQNVAIDFQSCTHYWTITLLCTLLMLLVTSFSMCSIVKLISSSFQFHAGELNAIVYKFRRQPLTRTLRQLVLEVQGVCSIKSEQNVSSNIALWMPLTAGHGYGVCLGTQQGEVLFWRLTEPYDIDDNQHAMSYRMIELHDNVVPRVSTYSPTYS